MSNPTLPMFEAHPRHEVVIDSRTGKVRQAGTVDPAAAAIEEFRALAEQELYIFAKYVMGMSLMTDGFHRGECSWLQKVPPRRKLWLTPRNHLKSSVVRSMIAHVLVQPLEGNNYFPGCQDKICRFKREELEKDVGVVLECEDIAHRMPGVNTRILLGRETAKHAEAGVKWLEGQWENNDMLRALWPHCVWPKGVTPKRGWNQTEMTCPRTRDRVEPSVYAIGVGGAATGWHFDMHTFDDLVTNDAANSPVVMEGAIQCFKDWRALLDSQEHSLEYTIGTHWAVRDLYYTIMYDFDGARHPDPTVAARVRSIVEDGQIVFPEMGYSWKTVLQLQAADPVMFALMYMNSLSDPNIADFNMAEVREFDWDGECLVFGSDERDALLGKLYGKDPSGQDMDPAASGPIPMNDFIKQAREGSREEYLRMKWGGVKGT